MDATVLDVFSSLWVWFRIGAARRWERDLLRILPQVDSDD